MLTDLVILQIILPLAGGLVSFLLPKRFSWLFATIIMGFTLLISVLLLKATASGNILSYHLGGWSPSIGIEYKVTKLNGLFMLLISFISLLNLLGMRDLISKELEPKKYPLFFGLLLIAITGLLGVCISNDIFNIYVLLEVNAIASYALVASAKKTESAQAAFDYLIFGTIGSTFILFGIGFIYAIIGSLNLSEISYAMPAMLNNNAIKAGALLILIGILMKAALFPLSGWLVNIYQGAPSFVSAILASITNKVGIYLLIHLYFDVFYVNQAGFSYLNSSLLALGLFSVIACAGLAYRQSDIKRFLSYSSLSQIGFIIFAIMLASGQGINSSSISGALIYCFTHALDKTALFLSAGYLIAATSREKLDDFAGIFKNYPWICVIIIINLLSLIGFPMTAGFIGKWTIFNAALEAGIAYAIVIMLAALCTFAYAFKFAQILFFTEKDDVVFVTNSRMLLWVLTFISGLNIYLGINSKYLLALW